MPVPLPEREVLRTLTEPEAALARRAGRWDTGLMIVLAPLLLLAWIVAWGVALIPWLVGGVDAESVLVSLAGLVGVVALPMVLRSGWRHVRWLARMEAGQPVYELCGVYERRSVGRGSIRTFIGGAMVDEPGGVAAEDVAPGRRVVAEVIEREGRTASPFAVRIRRG
jgi:hypothetical protein